MNNNSSCQTNIEFDVVVKIPPKKVTPVTFIITSIKKGKFRDINNSSNGSVKK